MKTKKIIFHFTHCDCLGHSTRLFSVIRALQALGKNIKIYVLHGSPLQPSVATLPGVTHLEVPFPSYSRSNFYSPLKKHPEYASQRADFILQAVRTIRPRAFVTEFFPFGRQELWPELLPAIRFARQNLKARLLCSLGYPFSNLERFSTTQDLLAFYDKIFLHVPAGTEDKAALRFLQTRDDREKLRRLFAEIKNKTVFTNYVLPYHAVPRKGKKPSRPLILATRGAGAYFPRIVSTSLKLRRYFKGFDIRVVAGPSTTAEEWEVFKTIAKMPENRGVSLFKQTAELPSLMRASSVLISTAAYNTSVLSLYYGSKGVMIPFSGSARYDQFWEQPSRARWLGRLTKNSVLDYQELTPPSLASEVARQLASKARKNEWPDSFFTGARQTARELLNEL
ncbi:MAG: hypothetical protein WC732_04750 [Candidatus Omnitrophota bacterium]